MKTTFVPGKCIISAQVDDEQRDELLRLARDADRSLSAEVRRAVAAHLRRTADHEETTHATL
jgi:predicted transcriptional regulator